MRYVLHILAKDVRGLRWELSVAVAVTLGMAVLQVWTVSPQGLWLREISPMLAVLAWVLLTVQLVQADALVGTEHDWRTRPIRSRDLVTAKVLFVAAFIGVPMVVGDVIVLMGNGFAPLNYMPGMIWKLLWLSVAILLPAAALGAITRTVPQALLAALGTAIVLVIGLGVAFAGGDSWGGMDWVRSAWMGLAGSVVGVVVLWMQFGSHRTLAARVVAAGGTVLVILTTWLMPWAVGFGVQKSFATQVVEGVRVVPQLDSRPNPILRSRLVISMVDVPEGYQARALRGQVRVEVDGVQIVTDSAGDGALAVEADGHRESPARIHGRVWLAILARQVRREFASNEGYAILSGLGVCQLSSGVSGESRPWANFSCQSPYRLPAVSSVMLKAGSAGTQMDPLSASSNYSPMPSELMLSPVLKMGATVRHEIGALPERNSVIFETWTPVAYVERSFTVDVKRLGDYVAGETGR